MRVVTLVPAFNEANRIGKTVQALKELPINEIIVVDDGSTDTTKLEAQKAGAKVIAFKKNQGKGEALKRALGQLPSLESDYFLFIDADLGSSAKEAGKLLEPLLKDKADMSVAILPPPPRQRRGGFGLVKGLASWGIKRATGRKVKAPLSGQRAVKKQVLEKLSLEKGFGMEVGLTIDAIKAGFRIEEVPTEMCHAFTGRNFQGFFHRGRQFLDILKVILKRL